MIKLVIVFSVKKTGTWFTINMLRTASDKVTTLGTRQVCNYMGNVLDNILTNHIDEDYIKQIIERIPPKVYRGSDLIVTQGHHELLTRGWFLKTLIKEKPKVPIAIPCRDPLLSVNSKCWRWFRTPKLLKAAGEDRLIVANKIIKPFINIITKVPFEHVFVFPIDIPALQDEQFRVNQCVNLLKYYGLTPTNKTIKVAKEWMPQNKTTVRFKVEKILGDSNYFKEVKQAIIQKDVKVIKEAYPEAFKVLQKQELLKKKMQKLGYKDLAWW